MHINSIFSLHFISSPLQSATALIIINFRFLSAIGGRVASDPIRFEFFFILTPALRSVASRGPVPVPVAILGVNVNSKEFTGSSAASKLSPFSRRTNLECYNMAIVV